MTTDARVFKDDRMEQIYNKRANSYLRLHNRFLFGRHIENMNKEVVTLETNRRTFSTNDNNFCHFTSIHVTFEIYSEIPYGSIHYNYI